MPVDTYILTPANVVAKKGRDGELLVGGLIKSERDRARKRIVIFF